ncbi:c2h2-type zinc finger transcription factor [Gigaspora margarita]|uniref:C2h2-type zinc finger transcription factor n=1 Tax=Gigaspora margarita TaxID=4874 RepID=A0A8H4A0A3_GIGMA|nr:c2h2-type zinc finger transcription factor [Gigaspora margarita]
MSKVDNFRLESQPNSEINPTLTASQVFDQYTRNLTEIAAIKNIDPNIIQYINDLCKNLVKTECLKVIGDVLIKKISEDSQNVNDEINNFFQSPSEKQSSNLFREIESDNNELVELEYETDENKCDKAPSKIEKLAFYEACNAIPDASKMWLKSERVVEDILFNYVKNKDYKDKDEKIRSLFSKTEWNELISDLLELHKIVNTPYLQDGVDYDVQQHYNLEWIQMFIRALQIIKDNLDVLNSKANYDIESYEDDLLNELIEVDILFMSLPSSCSVRYFANC